MNDSAKRAIGLLGGRKKLAQRLGVSYEAVRKWEETGVPMRRCGEILKMLGGQMRLHDLHPEFEASDSQSLRRSAA